jgi:hypothetical protein
MPRLTSTLMSGVVSFQAAVCVVAGPARGDATASDYPGSVLHVTVTGPTVAGQPLTIVATGSNDVGNPGLSITMSSTSHLRPPSNSPPSAPDPTRWLPRRWRPRQGVQRHAQES